MSATARFPYCPRQTFPNAPYAVGNALTDFSITSLMSISVSSGAYNHHSWRQLEARHTLEVDCPRTREVSQLAFGVCWASPTSTVIVLGPGGSGWWGDVDAGKLSLRLDRRARVVGDGERRRNRFKRRTTVRDLDTAAWASPSG